MIDPYWTVIPVMLVHYYATHPLANYNLWRSKSAIFLTWIWSLRLTHNYFRRENWQWGAREDWRFSDMSHQYGRHWWWISFFAVYVAQQVPFSLFFLFVAQLFVEMPQQTLHVSVINQLTCITISKWGMQVFLIGLSLPFYIIHTVEAPLSIWDFVAIAVCLTSCCILC